MWVVGAIIGLAIGAGLSLQSLLNATVTRTLGIWAASLLSFSTGALLLFVPVLFTHQWAPRRTLELPLWLLVSSGTIGALMVVARTFLVPRIGVAAMMAFVVVGQLASGVVFDQLGFMGFRKYALTPERGLGVALLIIGMLLVIGE